jgi:catechol 2,3-dioxygenase-like lactoylglutathione lyase family enzyme
MMAKNQPESSPFSELHHLSIVVRDIDATQRFYESIGVGPFVEYPPMREYVDIRVPDEEGFYNLKIRCASIGPVQLQLVQPGEGGSIYKDFLEKHGEGVFHLGFVTDDVDTAQAGGEAMGLNVLSSGRRKNGTGFTYFDTAERAGVTLLVRQSPPAG